MNLIGNVYKESGLESVGNKENEKGCFLDIASPCNGHGCGHFPSLFSFRNIAFNGDTYLTVFSLLLEIYQIPGLFGV